jgi:hypothetical protein
MKILNNNSPVKLFFATLALLGLPCLTLFIIIVNMAVR